MRQGPTKNLTITKLNQGKNAFLGDFGGPSNSLDVNMVLASHAAPPPLVPPYTGALKTTNLRGQTAICRCRGVSCKKKKKLQFLRKSLLLPYARFTRRRGESAKFSGNMRLGLISPLKFVPLSASYLLNLRHPHWTRAQLAYEGARRLSHRSPQATMSCLVSAASLIRCHLKSQ